MLTIAILILIFSFPILVRAYICRTNRCSSTMFAPFNNVPEDPATGSAYADLTAYWLPLQTAANIHTAIVVEQGVEWGVAV